MKKRFHALKRTMNGHTRMLYFIIDFNGTNKDILNQLQLDSISVSKNATLFSLMNVVFPRMHY